MATVTLLTPPSSSPNPSRGDSNYSISPRPRIVRSDSSRHQMPRRHPGQRPDPSDYRDGHRDRGRGWRHHISKALPSFPQTADHTTNSASSSSPSLPPGAVESTTFNTNSPAPGNHDYDSSNRSTSPSNTTNSNGDATTVTTVTTVGDASAAAVIPPLTRVHFYCYHAHRTFAPSRNTHNPVACMTCLRTDDGEQNSANNSNSSSDSSSENGQSKESGDSNADTEADANSKGANLRRRRPVPPPCRWRCTFCCLRICTECKQGLFKCKDRSLMVFMEELVTALEQQGRDEKEQQQQQVAQEEGASS